MQFEFDFCYFKR